MEDEDPAAASLVRATGGFLDEVAAQIEANDQLTVRSQIENLPLILSGLTRT